MTEPLRVDPEARRINWRESRKKGNLRAVAKLFDPATGTFVELSEKSKTKSHKKSERRSTRTSSTTKKAKDMKKKKMTTTKANFRSKQRPPTSSDVSLGEREKKDSKKIKEKKKKKKKKNVTRTINRSENEGHAMAESTSAAAPPIVDDPTLLPHLEMKNGLDSSVFDGTPNLRTTRSTAVTKSRLLTMWSKDVAEKKSETLAQQRLD
eukprot:g3504.t1